MENQSRQLKHLDHKDEKWKLNSPQVQLEPKLIPYTVRKISLRYAKRQLIEKNAEQELLVLIRGV